MNCHRMISAITTRIPATKALAALAALSLAGMVCIPATAQDVSGDNKEVTELESVVVEGSKSNQSLIDSNSSVQVLPSQKLEEADVTDVKGLSKLVPGLVVEPRGDRTYAGFTLRGISSANYFSPALSVYVDGVLQDSAFALQELTNVKSVEILKGPQGTLYGGNSHGGIINIVTFKGSEDPFAQISVSADRFTQRSNAVLSTPIGYGFAADLSLFHEAIQGTVDNTATATRNANGAIQNGVNLGLYYRPDSSPFSAFVKLKVDDLDGHEEFYISEQEFKDGSTDPNNFLVVTNPRLARDLKSGTLNMKYELTDALALEGTLGTQRRKSDRNIIGGTYDEEIDKTSQEIRLQTTKNDGVSFVLGLYHERTEWRYDSRVPFPQIPGGLFIRGNRVVAENSAIFADATVGLTPIIDVSAGVRYGIDKSEIDFKGGVPGGDFAQDREDNIFLPKLGLGLKLDDRTKVFATASAGYRPSGYNYIPSGPAEDAGFDAELSRNYEVGIKSAASGAGLSFNAALYYIELEKVQVYVGISPSQILKNLGNAESKGVEADATYAFNADRSTNLTLGVNWGKAVYTSGNEDTGFTDNRLQYSPETTANLAGQLKVADAGIAGKVLVGGSARYRSKFYFDEANTFAQDAHTLLDAHLKYVTKSGSSVQLFGKNLGDVIYATYKFGGFGGGVPLGTWGHRRTFGIAGTILL